MKTRIFYTKFWEDDYVSTLSPIQKYLFMYFILNQRIGQTGIYEVADRIVLFETGVTKDQLTQAKEEFTNSNKIIFHQGWVKVVNAGKLNTYTGESNEKAYVKELESIPSGVQDSLNTPPTGSGQTVDSLINHKSVIRNNKSEIEGIVKGRLELPLEDLQGIADKYQVPLSFVLSKQDDVNNWISEKAGRSKGRNLRITLMAWVKKDAIARMDTRKGINTKSAVYREAV